MFIKTIFILLLFLSSLSSYDKIIIGTIDAEAESKFSKFQALADYLQKELNRKDIKFAVEIPKDINTAIKLINEKKLDIFIDSVYPILVVQKQTDISIEAKRWKKGSEGYKSVVFTKKESNINKIKDLVGKSVAFEDNFSTTAYFIPKRVFEKNGLIVSNEAISSNVKYSFARSEQNAAAWVLFSKVDVAVTDDVTFKSFNQNLFKVIYKSRLIPRHLVSFSKKISPSLKKEILTILFNMDKKQKGKDVLTHFSKTKKFSPLTKDDIDFLKDFN